MKILFYNHTGQISGAERVLLMILRGLDSRRFDAVVACPPEGRLGRMVSDLQVRTISIDSLRARFTWRPDRLIRYLGSFFQVIRSARLNVIHEAPDIVHANSIRGGLVMSAATFGLNVPIVWHVHDLLPRHLLSVAIRLFLCLSRRNQVIAVSHAVAARLRGILLRCLSKRVPVHTIHNAVDLERFRPDSHSRKETRCGLRIAEEQLVIGIVGQLTARKQPLELIRAFAKVASEVPNAVLLIVGEALFNRDAEYAESLVQTTDSLGLSDRIRFLGSREDIPALMRAFDLLVVNSRAEAFGLTNIEAMATGTPVLAAAVDGIKEIIHHDQDGWLFDSQPALADGMIKLLRDGNLRARLSRQSRRSVMTRFSAERLLTETQSFYRGVLASGKTPQHKNAAAFEVKLSAD